MSEEIKRPDFQSVFSKSKNSRIQQERDWKLNLHFLDGEQWWTYDAQKKNYVRNRTSGRNQITVNLIRPMERTILSNLSMSYPAIVVLPASPSSEDIVKAQASEAAVRYYWAEADLEAVFGEIIEWLMPCGSGGLHTYYDPGLDRVVTKPVSPFNLFYEAKVSKLSDSQFILVRTYETADDLSLLYPDFKDKIESLSSSATPESSDQLNSQPSDRLEVLEWYYRDGRHFITCEDLVLFEEVIEEVRTARYFPVTVMTYGTTPGRLYGSPMITDLRGLQVAFNQGMSRILDNIDLVSNPKVLIPTTANVPSDSFTNRVGEKVPYNPAGGAPSYLNPPTIPGYTVDMINRAQSLLNDVGGIHSTSMGKRSVGVSSGVAIEALSAKDTSQLQVTQQSIERAAKAVATSALVLMKLHYGEGRMMRMLDGEGRVVFHELNSTDIIDVPEIFLQAGSLFRSESQDRDRRVLDMLQLGLLDKGDALAALSFHTGSHAMISKKVVAMSHARDMLAAVQAGAQIEISAVDDLASFREVFGEFIRNPDYYSLGKDRQDYIWDIYTAVSVEPSATPEEAALVSKGRLVFPRPVNPGADSKAVATAVLTPESSEAQFQQAAAAGEAKAQGADYELLENTLARRQEALMGAL